MGQQKPHAVQQGERQSFAPGLNNPEHQHRLKTSWQSNSPAAKNPGVTVDAKLSVSQWHVLMANRQTTDWPVFIKMNVAADQGKLLSSSTWHAEAAHGILHPILGCHAQKRLEETGGGPANSCSDGQSLEYVPCEKLKEPGLLHLTERRSLQIVQKENSQAVICDHELNWATRKKIST